MSFKGRYLGGMGEAGNREKGKGYYARRIWDGPDETCWHVWLEAPVTHQFRKASGATVTFVQLHGTGTQQIVRIIPNVDHQYMTDRALLTLYLSPKPEQMLGSGVGDVAHYGRLDQQPITPL